MNGAVNGTMEDPETVAPPSPPADSVVSKKGTDEGADVETPVTPCNNSNGTEDTTPLDDSHKGEDPAVNSKPDIENQNDESTDCPDLHNHKEQTNTELPKEKCSDEPSSTEDTTPTTPEKKHKGEDPVVNSKPDVENQNDESSECPHLHNHKEQSKTEVNKKDCSDDETSNKNCSSNDEETQDPVGSPVTKSDIKETKKEKANESKSKKVSEDGSKTKTNLHKLMNYLGKMENNYRKEIEYSEDSDDMSSDEDSEGYQRRPAETVSIDSDSDTDNHDNDTNDIVLVEDITPRKQNGNNYDSGSPEVHEIDSDDDNDDCIVTEDNISKTVRSNKSGTFKSKRKSFTLYDLENGGDESDVEVISTDDDPLNTSAKKMKTDNNKNNEPSLVIVDTNTILAGKDSPPKQQTDNSSNITPMNTSNLYQSIAARGTTVTAIKVSSTPSTQSAPPATPPAAPPEPLLPSLTDDMFVVEAPSFIVPYVYEKPSMKPFREFVDILGKELEEQKLKEERERLEKEKLEKEKREKEKQERKERRERGEQVESDVEEVAAEDDEKKKKSEEKKERRRRRKNPDDDDVSWDGESSSESEDDIPSDEDKVEIVKEIDPDIEEITDVITDLSAYKSTGKTDNYFDCSLGKFFMNIGLNLVTEYVQNDLLKQQNRKLKREKKAGHNTKATTSSISSLEKNLELSKENNAPYAFKQIKCEFCSFKTESTLAMDHHLETPHMKNNLYKCNFCPFEVRAPHEILLHMEKAHTTKARLERGLSSHQCVNCPFEDNGKGKMARHAVSCAKKFKPDFNLSPPVDWEPPAKIPKLTKQRNVMGGIPGAFGRQMDGKVRPISKAAMLANMALMKNKNNRLLPFAPRPATPPAPPRPVPRNTFNTPFTVPALNTLKIDPKPTQQSSLSITPVPRTPAPPLPAPPDGASKGTFVICEICDGYIKDLEQLRNHMQWIHKVKIHPKMIYNRPPLNCQKCQFRFFTDKGLERHLLGSHGLVTSCMQEAANKGKDAGRCPVCGRVYQWKLLFHVAKDHNLTLKPAHLSYKCTVCTATFGMYKQFENHVYSAHRVVAKRVADAKGKPPAAKSGSDAVPKPLKINDEITITSQSKAGPTTSKAK